MGCLPAGGRALVLVDGRSGAGKSTFAARAARLLGAALVHTDDVAWHLDMFDWAEALLTGIVDPWRRGERVAYRPAAWVARSRPGAIVVPATRILVVEGAGAGRAALAEEAELVVWVQSDTARARAQGVARDVASGRKRAEVERFWDEWAAAEEPFLAADRPWSRAALFVNGTPASGTPLTEVWRSGPSRGAPRPS